MNVAIGGLFYGVSAALAITVLFLQPPTTPMIVMAASTLVCDAGVALNLCVTVPPAIKIIAATVYLYMSLTLAIAVVTAGALNSTSPITPWTLAVMTITLFIVIHIVACVVMTSEAVDTPDACEDDTSVSTV